MDCRKFLFAVVGAAIIVGTPLVSGQLTPDVSYQRLVNAEKEPHNWLTYSGTYFSQRYSLLDQVTTSNVSSLELQWIYQAPVFGPWQATPLVVDGIMYTTQRPNDVMALDAATGRVFWSYRHVPASDHQTCCGSNNRGLAIAGDTLFMATLDAQLVALNARTGRPVWKTAVADYKQAYSMTLAPLVIKNMVVVGVGGSDRGVRGFVAAYDVRTGAQRWRFDTVPAPGEPGHDTWERCPPSSSPSPTEANYCDPEAWKHGGAAIWLTGSYDSALNLTYWGTGNVWPDYNPVQRPGDNLYTESVIALDADTGKLRWHFQFTPNGRYDYDAVQIPVLADLTLLRAPVKAMLWANRNGFFYVLDRRTGKFLLGKPFVKVNWASHLDETGRPMQTPQPIGVPTWPGIQGGTNWYSPSYSPRTGLFYASTWHDYATNYGERVPVPYREGGTASGGRNRPYVPVEDAPPTPVLRRGPINNWTEAAGHGAVLALDPTTGAEKWRFNTVDVSDSGILTTASDLLVTGGREGYFYALNARTGELLWKANMGGQIVMGPITYQVNGKQYIAATAGNALFAFALRE
jgi:alcohol dehydrogenase (cytochrome c)